MIESFAHIPEICVYLSDKQLCVINTTIDCGLCNDYIVGMDSLWRRTPASCLYITLTEA